MDLREKQRGKHLRACGASGPRHTDPNGAAVSVSDRRHHDLLLPQPLTPSSTNTKLVTTIQALLHIYYTSIANSMFSAELQNALGSNANLAARMEAMITNDS